MTAERLRQAAERLREVVNEAQCACGGPVCGPEKWFHAGELESRMDGSEKAVPFMLTMNPTVALALANWLEQSARTFGIHGEIPDPSGALAVADAILGEA